ncbi:MAG: alpha-glucan family phosphorylase, partial [Rikenellaceae bacterium]
PLYYSRFKGGVPTEWMKYVKNCIADVASNFTMNRMIIDYEDRFYLQLAERNEAIRKDDFAMAGAIADWKSKVNENWGNIRVIDTHRTCLDNVSFYVGKEYHFDVTLDIANLATEDVGVELIVANNVEAGQRANIVVTEQLVAKEQPGGLVTYSIDYTPENTGVYDVALRIYPKSEMLSHRMDMPLVKWA